MNTVGYLLRFAAQLSDQPLDFVLDAQLLLAHVLGVSRASVLTWPQKSVSEKEADLFQQLLKRRLAGEPLAYLTGSKEFWSLPFKVDKAVLIPRPETELLVELVLEQSKATANEPLVIWDWGTGSGAIACALGSERSQWSIIGFDSSLKALSIAQHNAQALGLRNCFFKQFNWFEQQSVDQSVDIIVSNPPYISEAEWPTFESGLRFEPRQALVSGPTGLESLQQLVQIAPLFLKKDGFLALEHGFSQGSAVRQCFHLHGFYGIKTLRDLAGLERVTAGCLE